jgi:hypothetical protein
MNPQIYRSYLLRLWRSSTGEARWHASLESPLTGKRQGFATLHDLFAFLTDLTAEPTDKLGVDGDTLSSNPIDRE